MDGAGGDRIKQYLAKHTTRAAIETNALSLQVIDDGLYRTVKRLCISRAPPSTFILKTPTPNTVPRQIENEVAAIKYVRARTSRIPTPEVLAYSTSSNDSWIILQDIPGTRLAEAWPQYSRDTKWQVLQNLVDLYKLFAAITSLDAFGATQIGGLNLDMTLGQTVEPAKSHGRQMMIGYRQGPYKNVEDYLSSYVDKEILYYSESQEIDMELFDYDESDDESSSTAPSSYDKASLCDDVETAEDDFERVEKEEPAQDAFASYVHIPTMEMELQREKNKKDFIDYLQDMKRLVCGKVDKNELPCLTHNNLHAQNIVVNEDHEIVALYHWEFAGFYPLSLTFEAPRMYPDDSPAPEDDPKDWCEAFQELFGSVKEVHPLVAAVLEPMSPLLTNAWE